MPSERFNRDMDDYIRSRRRKQQGSSTVHRDAGDKGISIEYDSPGFWEKFLSLFETIEEEEPEERIPPDELSDREMKKLEKTIKGNKSKEPQIMIEDEKGNLEVPRPSFFDRLLSFFGFVADPEEAAQAEMEDFDPSDYAIEESERVMYEEDVKEVIKIAHTWIEKLPSKKKKEFKESADFERYQGLLDKLGLLAKKQDVSLDNDLD